MIKIFFGEDRAAAEAAVQKFLGEDYEVFDGEELTVGDLPSVFQGTSLFGVDERRILLKNLTENKEVWGKVGDYAKSEHRIAIWEAKIDKRSVVYKKLVERDVEMQEFKEKLLANNRAVFGILDLALRDGALAVKEVEKIEDIQDPYMFVGLLVTQMLKKLETSRGGRREKQILKRLSELDMRMKNSGMESWMLIKAFLLEIGGK